MRNAGSSGLQPNFINCLHRSEEETCTAAKLSLQTPQQQGGSCCVLGADAGFLQGSQGAGPCRLWCLASTQRRLLSRHSDAQSCSLLCARLLVKPRACASTPACDSGSWSPSCWHGECFLPTTHRQLLLHAASHGLPCRVLAPASPSWVQLPAWQAHVPSWMSPEPASLAVPGCFPALGEQLLEPGSAGCKLGHSSPEWLCLLAPCLLPMSIWRRLRLTAQPYG